MYSISEKSFLLFQRVTNYSIEIDSENQWQGRLTQQIVLNNMYHLVTFSFLDRCNVSTETLQFISNISCPEAASKCRRLILDI